MTLWLFQSLGCRRFPLPIFPALCFVDLQELYVQVQVVIAPQALIQNVLGAQLLPLNASEQQ